MRILYALQGTGNGHAARARHLIPLLAEHATVDVWISGTESQLDIPATSLRSWSGVSLKYNRRGGLSAFRTIWCNHWLRFIWDVLRAPVGSYDLVVNDFEPVSAWAVKLKGGSILEVSHQAGVRHPKSPRPKKRSILGEWILRHYAPSPQAIGFHVQAVAPWVYPPLIRDEIRRISGQSRAQVLVYLPAYSLESLSAAFADCPIPVRAFVPKLVGSYASGSLTAEPVTAASFLEAFAASDSVVCSAGFELPTEALFHGKRVAVIPIKGQYEQECNAVALRKAGAWQVRNLESFRRDLWLKSPPPQPVRWPDYSNELVREILSYAPQQLATST